MENAVVAKIMKFIEVQINHVLFSKGLLVVSMNISMNAVVSVKMDT
jgi:hypothetical protein